jgi:DNA repair exonuclease SbcCD ATPase subunit
VELNNERIRRQNLELTCQTLDDQLKSDAAARKEIQAALETVSTKEADVQRQLMEMKREKTAIEQRSRDLETNLLQVANTATSRHPYRSRPRSSSTSNIHISSLERELAEVHALATQRETEVQRANERATRAQADAIRAENDAIATERRLKEQLKVAQGLVSEREEEIALLKSHHDAGQLSREREDELIQRIDEEEAKVMTLEKLLASSRDVKGLENALAKAEKKLKVEAAKVHGVEERMAALTKENAEIKRELEDLQSHSENYASSLASKEAQLASLNAHAGLVLAYHSGRLLNLIICWQ